MKDEKKTKKQLIEELAAMRRKLARLKTPEARRKKTGGHRQGATALYFSTIDSLEEILHVVDTNMHITLYNKAFTKWCRSLGLAEDPINRSVSEVFPFLPDRVRDEYRQVFDTGRTLITQEKTEIKGDIYVTETRKIPVKEDGKIVRVITIVRDITDQKRAEQSLKESEARYRAVVEGQTSLICRWLPEGRLTFVNDAYCRYFGKTRGELEGHSFMPLIPKEDRAKVKRHFDSLNREHPTATHEHRVIAPNGEIRWQQWTNRATYDQRGLLIEYLSVGRDISERKFAEEELKKYREQLEDLVAARTAQLQKANEQLHEEIEERKRAQKELLASQDRLQLIFDYAPEAYYLTDVTGKFVDGNKAAEEISGYSKEELISKNVVESKLLPPEEVPKASALLARNAQGFATGPTEFVIVRKDKSRVGLEITSFPVKIDDQTLILNIARDVTERKLAEEQLRVSEERFRSTFQQAAVGIAHLAPDGRFLRVNRRFCDIVGYQREELLQRTSRDISHPEDIEAELEYSQRLLAGEIPDYSLEKLYLHKDGFPVWVALTVSLVRQPSGQPAYFIAVAEDIGQRKWTEEELVKSEERLKILFEFAPEGYFLTDIHGILIDGNRAFEELSGHPKSDFLGKNLLKSQLLPKEQIPKLRAILNENARGRPTGSYEFTFIRKDRSQVLAELSAFPVEIEGQTQVLIIARDITERKKAAQAIRESEERYRGLFNGGAEGILVADIKTKGLLYCNPALSKILGYTEEEIKGLKVSDLHPKEALKHAIAEFEAQARGEKSYAPNIPCLRKDGEIIFADINTTLIQIDGRMCNVGFFTDITERKLAEEKLRESEETARALMNATSDSAILADIHGNILALNEAAAQRFGRPMEALIGSRGTDIVPPKVSSYRLNQLKKVFRTGRSVRFEDERDGIIFDTIMYPIRDAQENVSRMAVFGRDITEEVRAKENLRRSEQKYRELMELLPQTVFELDLKGNIITTNRAGLEAFGYTQQDIDKGLNVAQLYSPDDRKRILENIEKKMRGASFEDHEYVALRKDGSTFPVIIFSSPIVRDGKPIGLRGIVVDITERKRAEQALCRSEQTVRMFLNANDDPAALIEPKGTVLAINTAFAERLHESESGLVGKNVYKYFPPEAARLRKARAAEAVRSKKPVRFDDQSRGDVVYDTSVYPILGPGGQVDQVAIFTRDITERKHMEETLRESEEKFRNLAENMVDAIFLTDQDGRITYMSPAVHEIIGYRPEECVGKLFHAFVKRSDIPRAILDFSTTIKGTPSRALQLDLKRKDKTAVSIELSATPVMRNGRVVGTQGVIRDISERLHAITDLEESEEKYRKIVELAPDGIIATDQEGLVTSCNTAFLRQFGLSEDHIVGKHFLESSVMMPQSRAKYQQMFNAIMSGKAPQSFEIEWSDKEGNIRDTEIHVSLKRQGRKKIGLQAILRDITERKRAEEALRESEEKHRNLIELAPDAIITFDRKGSITSCNQAALKMAGVAHEKYLIGKHFTKLAYVSKADLPRFRKFFAAAIRGKKIPPVEYAVSLKDGTVRWSEGIYTLLRKEGKVAGVQAIVRNITDRKREEQIQRTLYRISNAVHTTGDLQELYGEIYKELNALLKTTNFSIALYDKKRDLFSVQYHVDEKDRFEGEVPAGKSLTAYMIKGKKPLLLTGKQIQALKRAGKVKPIGSPVQIWLGVPLKLHGRIIGSLVLCDYHNEAAFDEKDLQMLEFVSNQVAISIDHKRFEDSLRESEDLFRSLADRSPHMIFINTMGTIAYINNKCVRVSGYTRKELYSRDFDFLTLVAPTSRNQVKRNFALHKQGQRVAPYRCTMKTKTGKHIEVLISTLMIQFAGQPAVLGIVTGLSGQADVL